MLAKRIGKVLSCINNLEAKGYSIEFIPESFEGIYKDDYNIEYIHHTIIRKMDRDRKKVCEDLLVRKEELSNMLLSKLRPAVEVKKIVDEISSIDQKYHEISNSLDKQKYLELTQHLIDRYNLLVKISHSRETVNSLNPPLQGLEGTLEGSSDFQESSTDTQMTEIDQERIFIIESYLNIAKNYITINLTRKVTIDNRCQNCHQLIEDVVMLPNGIEVCPFCYCERNTMQIKIPRDITKLQTEVTSDYDNCQTFLKVFRRFNGYDCEAYTSEIKSKLDAHFTKIGM